ncbi:MAG: helix-turn-helix domain-containing protein [Planctomycetota bacterium]
MSQSNRRSVCPIACTLDLIGDRWTLIVIRDLFAGKSHFKEFAGSPEGIATNILTSRLNRLVESDLVERRLDATKASHPEYRLTRKGRSLKPVLSCIADWGMKNIQGTAMKIRVD